MRQIVLATSNAGKLAEIRDLLSGLDWQIVPQSEFAIGDAVEDGLTFIENALLKARHAAAATGLAAIADDSGLEVDALAGAPGIHSARFAGSHGDDAANNALLLERLRGVAGDERTARFRCVAVYMRRHDDPAPVVAQGVWEGRILEAPRGSNGFGYDPLFLDEQLGMTGAELDSAAKNRISHRGQAVRALAGELQRLYGTDTNR